MERLRQRLKMRTAKVSPRPAADAVQPAAGEGQSREGREERAAPGEGKSSCKPTGLCPGRQLGEQHPTEAQSWWQAVWGCFRCGQRCQEAGNTLTPPVSPVLARGPRAAPTSGHHREQPPVGPGSTSSLQSADCLGEESSCLACEEQEVTVAICIVSLTFDTASETSSLGIWDSEGYASNCSSLASEDASEDDGKSPDSSCVLEVQSVSTLGPFVDTKGPAVTHAYTSGAHSGGERSQSHTASPAEDTGSSEDPGAARTQTKSIGTHTSSSASCVGGEQRSLPSEENNNVMFVCNSSSAFDMGGEKRSLGSWAQREQCQGLRLHLACDRRVWQ
ncbi:uncharacterized protein [Apteryx mantelli]|uniref:Uncharacterized protein n=1 Tax=Apteryx mantelli TaxID=2696672 RepID=A0ABM4E731_9AVES|nr:PREDICTED: uncharacterized protein LOC106492562 [Apteryx mantelli mantelli]